MIGSQAKSRASKTSKDWPIPLLARPKIAPSLAALAAVGVLTMGGAVCAQDAAPIEAPAAPPAATAEAPSAPAPVPGLEGHLTSNSAAKPAPGQPAESEATKPKGVEEWLQAMPLPVAVTLIVSLASLLSVLGNLAVALFVTPRVTREGIAVAARGATAAADSAAVAARSSENVGHHEVARLRQAWIDKVRDEIAELHSDLMNWRPLGAPASAAAKAAYRASILKTNVSLARMRLLLNAHEVASQNLLKVLGKLNTNRLTAAQRLRLCRWVIVWAQIVLKTEWDRVRDELHGKPPAQPKRRGDRR